jgi:hypothetical protein
MVVNLMLIMSLSHHLMVMIHCISLQSLVIECSNTGGLDQVAQYASVTHELLTIASHEDNDPLPLLLLWDGVVQHWDHESLTVLNSGTYPHYMVHAAYRGHRGAQSSLASQWFGHKCIVASLYPSLLSASTVNRSENKVDATASLPAPATTGEEKLSPLTESVRWEMCSSYNDTVLLNDESLWFDCNLHEMSLHGPFNHIVDHVLPHHHRRWLRHFLTLRAAKSTSKVDHVVSSNVAEVRCFSQCYVMHPF